jgi:GNAT superfamily N-acetyltransferase
VTTIVVRPARLEEHAGLCALFEELDAFHREGRPELFRAFAGPARSLDQIGRWLAGPGSTVLVAEEAGDEEAGDLAGDLVGLAVLLTRPPSAFAGAVPRKVIELDNLVVRADRRNCGIGERLLAETRRWARAEGATHIEVGVHVFNGEARRFYERFGFARSIDRLMMAA